MAELNIKDFLHTILRRWWILILTTAIAASIALVWTQYYLVPIYRAYTTVYVGKNIESQGINTAEISLGSLLIADYREIAKSRLVASTVIKELGTSYMNPDVLAGKINLNQRNSTRIVEISVTDTDPATALMLTNKVAEVFKKTVINIMKIENVQILDKAELPTYPISPNKSRNIKIGAIIGFVVGLGLIFLLEFLDDTLKTVEDVKEYVDLPVIGTIPVFQVSRKGA